MQGFEWAEQNLSADTPHNLQVRGVNVFFAPNISPDIKVVDLGSGRVELFQTEEHRPQTGYYIDYDDLERYCRENGIPLVETNGQVSTQPLDTREAGDPLEHRGE